MCDLLVDVQVEHDTVTATNDDPITLTAETGRVVIAVTAWIGNPSTAKPIATSLVDGALSDECTVYPSSAVIGTFPQTVTYSLTTGRVASL